MLALEDDRTSPRLKREIERILEISVTPEVRAARSAASRADHQARKAGHLSATAQARKAQAARRAAAAPLGPDDTLSIVQAAQVAGVTPAEIAAHKGASERFVFDVFTGERNALPWMFDAIAAAAARKPPAGQAPPEQAPVEQAEAAD